MGIGDEGEDEDRADKDVEGMRVKTRMGKSIWFLPKGI